MALPIAVKSSPRLRVGQFPKYQNNCFKHFPLQCAIYRVIDDEGLWQYVYHDSNGYPDGGETTQQRYLESILRYVRNCDKILEQIIKQLSVH